jgi:hypothetical protein
MLGGRKGRKEGAPNIYLAVKDVDEEYGKLKAKGVNFVRARAFTKLQVVVVIVILAAIAVGTAYYYDGLLISSPTPSPSPTLIPLPFDVFEFYPEANSTNVSLNTNITVYFTRPPPVVQLQLYPPAEGSISQLSEEVGAGTGRSTFVFSEPLKPGTTYTVTVTYGQENPPTGYMPFRTETWNFTTSP